MMHRFRIIFTTIILIAVSVTCYAGEEREGLSSTRGMILTFERGGLVGFDTEEKLSELVDHCSKGRSIFNHTLKRSYRCKVVPLPGEDSSQFARVEIIGATGSAKDGRPNVFTIKYSRFSPWEIRALLDHEKDEIATLLRADRNRYRSLIERMRFKEAVAVKKPNANFTTYFVPGEQINDEGSYYSAERYYVFVVREKNYKYQGRLVAKPLQFVDIDGDGFPEVVVEESCDGMCVSIWSVHNGLKRLGVLGGH